MPAWIDNDSKTRAKGNTKSGVVLEMYQVTPIIEVFINIFNPFAIERHGFVVLIPPP